MDLRFVEYLIYRQIFQESLVLNIKNNHTLEIPYNEKLEHRSPLYIERERDPLHILLVATREACF